MDPEEPDPESHNAPDSETEGPSAGLGEIDLRLKQG